MKYLGTIADPKDLVRKEYVDSADETLSTRINTNEDSIAMAESDIEGLQTDVNTLQTDSAATKAAVKTLQDTSVPNTRKINNKALDADITLDATDMGAQLSEFILTITISDTGEYVADKTSAELNQAYSEGRDIILKMESGIYPVQLIDATHHVYVFTFIVLQKSYDITTSTVSTLTLNASDTAITIEVLNGTPLVTNTTLTSDEKQSFQTMLGVPTAISQLTNDSSFVTATDVVPIEATTSINADTLESHPASYFATASSVASLAKIYSGTSDPSSTLGNDGDIYIKYTG